MIIHIVIIKKHKETYLCFIYGCIVYVIIEILIISTINGAIGPESFKAVWGFSPVWKATLGKAVLSLAGDPTGFPQDVSRVRRRARARARPQRMRMRMDRSGLV